MEVASVLTMSTRMIAAALRLGGGVPTAAIVTASATSFLRETAKANGGDPFVPRPFI